MRPKTSPTGYRALWKSDLRPLNFYVDKPIPMLNTDFKEFLALLTAHRVEYLVVGGYALAAYGHPRYTGDIDVWLNPEANNIELLIAVLAEFGFGSPGIKNADFMMPNAVIQLGYPPARIDLLSSIDGVAFASAHATRLHIEFGGIELPVISIANFKTNKLAVGRLQDLADVDALNKS